MLPGGCEARCPACSHRELSSSESEEKKSLWLSRSLEKWTQVLDPIRSASVERRWGYREKTLLHAVRGSDRWKFGTMIRRTLEIIPIPDCPVHSARVRSALNFLAESVPTSIELKYIAVSGGLATLVIKEKPGDISDLCSRFSALSSQAKQSGIEGIFACFNPSAGGRVFSAKGFVQLWGESTSENDFGPYGPQSFQQLIPELYRDALRESRTWLSPDRDSLVLDFYSGLGVSLREWRAAQADCIGIELLGESVRLAGPGILQGRVQDRIPQLESWLESRKKTSSSVLLFTNPPRTGMEDSVIAWIGKTARPRRIAYLSCSAGTLARDLSKLEDSAYRVKRIIPYDFFPQTHHVETLACLERVSDHGFSDPLPG